MSANGEWKRARRKQRKRCTAFVLSYRTGGPADRPSSRIGAVGYIAFVLSHKSLRTSGGRRRLKGRTKPAGGRAVGRRL